MIRIAFICLLSLCCSHAKSQTATPNIFENSVLVYKVKEGTKTYSYTVTIRAIDYDELRFDWKTDGTAAKKGKVYVPNFDGAGINNLVIGNFKNGNEDLLAGTTRLFMPTITMDQLADITGEPAAIQINGQQTLLIFNQKPINRNTKIIYNKKAVGGYKEVADVAGSIAIGFISCGDNSLSLVTFYQDKTIRMELISLTTPIATPVKKVETKSLVKKMEPVKFASVSMKYPILARVENYDPTKGHTVSSPFPETYDFRMASNTANPPSLTDCFICDLFILYNQKKSFSTFTGILDETVTTKSFPATAVTKLLNVYLKNEPNKTPGYRPWTHHEFVNSLSETERTKLAKDIEDYVKSYGVLEAK